MANPVLLNWALDSSSPPKMKKRGTGMGDATGINGRLQPQLSPSQPPIAPELYTNMYIKDKHSLHSWGFVVSDKGALPHAVHSGGRLFNLIKVTSVTMSSHLCCPCVAMHPSNQQLCNEGKYMIQGIARSIGL